MEFIPICLECDNYQKKDYCPYYQPIPFEIKNREIKCNYFSGGRYDLIGRDTKEGGGDDGTSSGYRDKE